MMHEIASLALVYRREKHRVEENMRVVGMQPSMKIWIEKWNRREIERGRCRDRDRARARVREMCRGGNIVRCGVVK